MGDSNMESSLKTRCKYGEWVILRVSRGETYFFLNVYLFLRQRETEHERGRVRERERETQNLKQAPGSELSAQSLMRGSNSRTVRS